MRNKEKRDFAVRGMTCDNCVRHVTRALQGVGGVSKVKVDLGKAKATVEYDAAAATTQAMVMAVQEAGYTLEV